jgi:hypothetical protein
MTSSSEPDEKKSGDSWEGKTKPNATTVEKLMMPPIVEIDHPWGIATGN